MPFICKDDQEPTPEKPKKPVRDRREDRRDQDRHHRVQHRPPWTSTFQAPSRAEKTTELDRPLERKRLEPSQLPKELQALEQQFLACPGPVDSEERLRLWPRLAELNSTLGHGSEAMICWANALWTGGADAPALARHWAAHTYPDTGGLLSQKYLEGILGQQQPSLEDVYRLAACVIAAPENPQAGPLRQRLADVQAFLQLHETLLPVRAVWLAGLALYQLSGGDVLALTRCRDRLLERLYRHSLRADVDLPKFLRFSAVHGERMRIFRDWLVKLPERVEHWLTHVDRGEGEGVVTPADPRNTNAYAQLILAFAMARTRVDEQECSSPPVRWHTRGWKRNAAAATAGAGLFPNEQRAEGKTSARRIRKFTPCWRWKPSTLDLRQGAYAANR